MTPDAAAALAVRCGAMVFGEAGTKQQYMMTAEQIAALLARVDEVKIPPPPY